MDRNHDDNNLDHIAGIAARPAVPPSTRRHDNSAGCPIPKSMQRFLSTTAHDLRRHPPRCSQCRGEATADSSNHVKLKPKMLRCTQCQTAHYCSKTCQQKHYKFHKMACRYVATLRSRALEESSSQSSDGGETYLKLSYALVSMAYRETDTVYNGRYYYRQAFQACMKVWECLGRINFFRFREGVVEDYLLVLYAILPGSNLKGLAEWCFETNSPRMAYFVDLTQTHDIPIQMIRLLLSMKALAEYRLDQSALKALEALPSSSLPSDNTVMGLPSDIVQKKVQPYLLGVDNKWGVDIATILQALQVEVGPGLRQMRDSVYLFTPDVFPQLMRGVDVGATAPPSEMWSLYQDVIFTTRGANDILHEFLPEDEDPMIDDQ